MSSQRTRWGVIAVWVGGLMGTGALAAEKPGPTPKESQAPAREELLSVKPGERKRVEMPAMTRVAVGDPSIADVQVSEDSVLEVKGVSEGKTTVLIWTEDGQKRAYQVHVRK